MNACTRNHPGLNCPYNGRDPDEPSCSHNYDIRCPQDKAFLQSPDAVAWLISYLKDGKPPKVQHKPTQRIINRLWPMAVIAAAAGVKEREPQ